MKEINEATINFGRTITYINGVLLLHSAARSRHEPGGESGPSSPAPSILLGLLLPHVLVMCVC